MLPISEVEQAPSVTLEPIVHIKGLAFAKHGIEPVAPRVQFTMKMSTIVGKPSQASTRETKKRDFTVALGYQSVGKGSVYW
jgi:hypothetical protein